MLQLKNNLVSPIIFGMTMSFIGISLSPVQASAAVLGYGISGNFRDGSTFFGNFSYDTMAPNNKPKNISSSRRFDLLNFEIFINDKLFISSETEQGGLSYYNFTDKDPTSVLLEFGSNATCLAIGCPTPTGFFLEITGVINNPSAIPPLDEVPVTNGFATSDLPNFPKIVDSDSVVISSVSITDITVPEPLTILGTTLVASCLPILKKQKGKKAQ